MSTIPGLTTTEAQPRLSVVEHQTLAVNPAPGCASCWFWRDRGQAVMGQCRRHAPTPTTNSSPPYWPVTEPADWCGEYRATKGPTFV